MSPQPQAIDQLLRASMAELLVPLRDPELGVRRVALVAFNSAAHNKPSLVRDLLPDLLPTIYAETKVKVSSVTWIAATSILPVKVSIHSTT